MSNSDKPTIAEKWLHKFEDNKLIAIAIVIAACVAGLTTFLKDGRELVSLLGGVIRSETVPVVLPNDTGWIFCGYYNDKQGFFIEEPSCEVAKTAYPNKSKLPRVGDRIRIVKERNLIIRDYATRGLSEQLNPPWEKSVLDANDYTGIKLPAGSIVSVRDVSGGQFPDHPVAIWIRVGSK